MRAVKQRQVQSGMKGMQWKGALGFTFDENNGVRPEVRMLAKAGNRQIRTVNCESHVMLADVRQHNGAAAAASFACGLKGPALG